MYGAVRRCHSNVTVPCNIARHLHCHAEVSNSSDRPQCYITYLLCLLITWNFHRPLEMLRNECTASDATCKSPRRIRTEPPDHHSTVLGDDGRILYTVISKFWSYYRYGYGPPVPL